LTDDRIRRLYKTYATHVSSTKVRRHRGKSPRQIAFFTRNTQAQFEASLLAGVFTAFGLLERHESAERDTIAYGTLFCDAYETHLQLLQSGAISFEHAWFLLQLLIRNTVLHTLRCRHCDGQFLHDRSSVLRRACPACRLKTRRDRSRTLRSSRKRQRPSTGIAVGEVPARPARGLADRLGA
jgi:hypothetical protein